MIVCPLPEKRKIIFSLNVKWLRNLFRIQETILSLFSRFTTPHEKSCNFSRKCTPTASQQQPTLTPTPHRMMTFFFLEELKRDTVHKWAEMQRKTQNRKRRAAAAAWFCPSVINLKERAFIKDRKRPSLKPNGNLSCKFFDAVYLYTWLRLCYK